MKKIEIVNAKPKDLANIMDYINIHWKRGHILSKNKKVFMHYYKKKKNLNFILAKENKKIVGILGYLKDSKFSKIKNKSIIWTSLLKVSNSYPGLGLKLVSKLIKKFPANNIGCNGNNTDSDKLFKLLGFNTFVLNQYYLINPNIKKFKLITHPKIKKSMIDRKKYLKGPILKKLRIKNHYSYLEEKFFKYKNANFFLTKYYKNKFYNYSIVYIEERKKIKSIFVFRIVKKKNRRAARIVDYAGNLKNFKEEIYAFYRILIENKCEYLDFFVNYNLPCNKNGLRLNANNKKVVIPYYFEPFIKKNVLIRSGILKNTKNQFVCKGDGDVERPNV